MGNKNCVFALLTPQVFSNDGSLVKICQKTTEPGRKVWKKDLPSLRADRENFSLYAAIELSSSFSVLRTLLLLVWNEKGSFPWSFFAPTSEDLAWISKSRGTYLVFHEDHGCSRELRWCKLSFLPVWHRLPLYPLRQLHAFGLVQFPALEHGGLQTAKRRRQTKF